MWGVNNNVLLLIELGDLPLILQLDIKAQIQQKLKSIGTDHVPGVKWDVFARSGLERVSLFTYFIL